MNSQNNEISRETGNSQSRGEPAYYLKNQNFRKAIRRQQLDQILKNKRERVLQGMCEDVFVDGVSLTETLVSFQRLSQDQLQDCGQKIDNIISNMFTLSLNDEQCNFNELLDGQMIAKMVSMLDLSNLQSFKNNPKTYILTLRLLRNYSAYYSDKRNLSSQISNVTMIRGISEALLVELANVHYYYTEGRFEIFSHPQTVEILYIALLIIHDLEAGVGIRLEMYLAPSNEIGQSVLAILAQEFSKIVSYTQQEKEISEFNTIILQKLLLIFQQALILKTYEENEAGMFPIDQRIVDTILKLLAQVCMLATGKDLQQRCLLNLTCFVQRDLERQPQILKKHDFAIIFSMLQDTTSSLASVYHDKKAQVQQKQFDNRIMQLEYTLNTLLYLFQNMFGFYRPIDSHERYQQGYYYLVQNFLLPIFSKNFQRNDSNLDKINNSMMKLLRTICLTESCCKLVIAQLPIINKLFYYIHPNDVSSILKSSLKRGGLHVFNNIIRISLQPQSKLQKKVVQFLKQKKILEVWAGSIGQFYCSDLNMGLLCSLNLFLQTQASQRKDNNLWIQFCSFGGMAKLQRFYNEAKDDEFRQVIELILDKYVVKPQSQKCVSQKKAAFMTPKEEAQWLGNLSPSLEKLTGRPNAASPRPNSQSVMQILPSQHSSTSSAETPTFGVPTQQTSTHQDR